MSEKITESLLQNTDVGIDNFPEEVKNLKKEVAVLFEEGAVNFEHVAENIDLEEMSPELLENIRGAVSNKIFEIMILGHFNDLRGARELMEKLGIEEIFIPEDDSVELDEDIKKLSERALIEVGLSQPAVMGEYDLETAREILINDSDYSENELSDDKIKKILNFRHLLLALKERKIDRLHALFR